MPHSGNCLCGETTVKVTPDQPVQVACHCTDCQKASGSSNSTNILVDGGDVEVTGPISKYVSKSASGNDVTREFCTKCGSSISHASSAWGGKKAIHTGLLPDFQKVKYAAEIFIASKFTGLPPIENTGQFERDPPH